MAMREHIIDVGYVYLESDDPKLSVHASLGTVKPHVVSNYGGWQVTARPKDVGLTDWMGRDPLKVAFDVLFDNWKERDAQQIERDIRALERMGGLYMADPVPPLIEFDSLGAVPHDNTIAPNRRWVIETLTEDEEYIERNRFGNRIRSRWDLVLMQYVEDERLARLSAAHRRRKRKKKQQNKKDGKGGSGRRTHTVRAGETLVSISVKEYKTPNRWDDIAKLNKIRDPRKLRVGQVLKLP